MADCLNMLQHHIAPEHLPQEICFLWGRPLQQILKLHALFDYLLDLLLLEVPTLFQILQLWHHLLHVISGASVHNLWLVWPSCLPA